MICGHPLNPRNLRPDNQNLPDAWHWAAWQTAEQSSRRPIRHRTGPRVTDSAQHVRLFPLHQPVRSPRVAVEISGHPTSSKSVAGTHRSNCLWASDIDRKSPSRGRPTVSTAALAVSWRTSSRRRRSGPERGASAKRRCEFFESAASRHGTAAADPKGVVGAISVL